MSRDAIADLVHRYADAVVHRDEAQWAATWADDAVWELGFGNHVDGRDAIVTFWNQAMDGFAAVVQNAVNGTVDLDDSGHGTGRWYVIEHWLRADGGAGILLAHYDDEYVLTEAGWRFAKRELKIHYLGPPDLSAPFHNRSD